MNSCDIYIKSQRYIGMWGWEADRNPVKAI